MSMILTAQAMQLKVGNATRKLVLLKLADNANDNGVCWPSYEYIADMCEVDRRTVMRHIKTLEEMGFVSVRTRKGEKGNSSNVYQLNLGSDKLSPPSDTRSRGVVSQDHQPSDPMSPGISHRTSQLEPIKNKQKNSSELESCFERLWAAFPTKKSKKNSLAKFKSIVTAQSEPPEVFTNMLCQDVENRVANRQFGFDKLHLTTYLNQERWNDDHEINHSSTAQSSNTATGSQANRVEQHNAELLARYGHTAAPSGQPDFAPECGGLDSGEVCGGIRSEVGLQGTTIDLDSSDFHDVGN
ncbi:helix-turn-helix domain-containing protein [Vibrio splendidus]|uniref:helix-turn-helix domain-containing protein n=1 Tax=Vibrio splendidus TaxID=29497 RepID=UPI000D391A47|nr:helix-turn-helix domain-containing protein [Vibrio splendidus]PTO69287.1 helix-turn-helix domain-containing protein [Vibrio splendidus]